MNSKSSNNPENTQNSINLNAPCDHSPATASNSNKRQSYVKKIRVSTNNSCMYCGGKIFKGEEAYTTSNNEESKFSRFACLRCNIYDWENNTPEMDTCYKQLNGYGSHGFRSWDSIIEQGSPITDILKLIKAYTTLVNEQLASIPTNEANNRLSQRIADRRDELERTLDYLKDAKIIAEEFLTIFNEEQFQAIMTNSDTEVKEYFLDIMHYAINKLVIYI